MKRQAGICARRRHAAAPLLLVLYLAAGLVAPVAHLVGHKDDHTHGPVVRPSSSGRAFSTATTDQPRRGHARDRDVASALASHGRLRWPWAAPDDDAVPPPASAPVEAPHTHGPGTPEHTHETSASHPVSDVPGATPHRHDPSGAPARPDAPLGHGAGSAAHFALAVIDAPPPVALPLPTSTRWQAAPPRTAAVITTPRRLQPARGPPVLV